MATVIMPKMGDGMEEGTLLRWLKKVGDQVRRRSDRRDRNRQGRAGDRGRRERQSHPDAGRRGATVPIGTAIAQIGAEGEAPAEAAAAAAASVLRRAAEPPRAGSAGSRAEPVAASDPRGQAPHGPTAAPATAAPAEAEKLRASPLVKRLAAEHEIDLPAFPAPVRVAASSRTIWRPI